MQQQQAIIMSIGFAFEFLVWSCHNWVKGYWPSPIGRIYGSWQMARLSCLCICWMENQFNFPDDSLSGRVYKLPACLTNQLREIWAWKLLGKIVENEISMHAFVIGIFCCHSHCCCCCCTQKACTFIYTHTHTLAQVYHWEHTHTNTHTLHRYIFWLQ